MNKSSMDTALNMIWSELRDMRLTTLGQKKIQRIKDAMNTVEKLKEEIGKI